MAESRFLEAPHVRQADVKLKNGQICKWIIVKNYQREGGVKIE